MLSYLYHLDTIISPSMQNIAAFQSGQQQNPINNLPKVGCWIESVIVSPKVGQMVILPFPLQTVNLHKLSNYFQIYLNCNYLAKVPTTVSQCIGVHKILLWQFFYCPTLPLHRPTIHPLVFLLFLALLQKLKNLQGTETVFGSRRKKATLPPGQIYCFMQFSAFWYNLYIMCKKAQKNRRRRERPGL